MELANQTKRGRYYAIFLAIVPVLMMYKVPLLDIGISTFLIAVTMFYAILVIFLHIRQLKLGIILPYILYCIYVIVRSDGDLVNILLCTAIVVHILAFSCGSVNIPRLMKALETISVIASVCVIFQICIHYLFGKHIPMIALDLCIDEFKRNNVGIILTGISDNMYRPSAFFLEPSHFAQYVIVSQISFLAKEKPEYKKAALVSAGIIATTSGMGIILTIFVWLWFAVLRSRKKGKSTSFLIAVMILFILLSILSQVSFFQSATGRITGDNGFSAIQGRLLYWDIYIPTMQGSSLIWGMGYNALPNVYFTGIMEILYCYGVVGVTLFYLSIVIIVIRSQNVPRCMAIVIGGLMLIANLTGFIMNIFFFGIIYAYIYSQTKNVAQIHTDSIEYKIV